MRGILFVTLALTGIRALADDVQHLPAYDVTADVIAAMIPCDQVKEMCDDAGPYRRSFDLSVITVVKAPTSRFAKPVRCFIRAGDGRLLKEITNQTLCFDVDRHWPTGFLSSNQPAEYAIFYLMMKPRLGPDPVTAGSAATLLDDYLRFAEKRYDRAVRYYGAGGSWGWNLRWSTIPDEIAFIARSPKVAKDIAVKLGVAANGCVVRVTTENLTALKDRAGAESVICSAADLDCLTPWSSLAGPPSVKDHAALFRLGWVSYRREPSDPGRRDFIAIAMQSAPATTE